MTAALYASAAVLLLAAVGATVLYARAVVGGQRAYVHVIFAFVFVGFVQAVALDWLPEDEGLLAANVLAIGAMLAVAGRYRASIKGGPRPSERSLPVMAFVILLAFNILAFAYADKVSRDKDGAIIEAAIDGCERQNEVRTAVRESFRIQNDTARATDPALFPDIPPEQFRGLIQQGIDTRQEAIRRLQPTDCEAEYPSD